MAKHAHLIATCDRTAYVAAVFAWLPQAIDAYKPGADLKALPPAFSFGPVWLQPAPLGAALARCRGKHAKAHKQLFTLAAGLLREATAADRKRLKQMQQEYAA